MFQIGKQNINKREILINLRAFTKMVSIHFKIRIFYCLIIPLTIFGWVVLILSCSWSISQLQSQSSRTNDDCQKVFLGVVFNILLSVIMIACCMVTFPFIWYLMHVIRREILPQENSYAEYREPAYARRDISFRESLPSYRTATMTGENTTEVYTGLLQDESMVPDGYSMRD